MTNVSQPRVRRVFRFRLRTLLALPLLFAAAWWYITWPERTAARFVKLLSADQIAAQAMFDGPPLDDFWFHQIDDRTSSKPSQIQAPTWREFFQGRRKFAAADSFDRVFHFEAARGRVDMDKLSVVYDVKTVTAKQLAETLNAISGRTDIEAFDVKKSQQVLVTVPREDVKDVKRDRMVTLLQSSMPLSRPGRISAEKVHEIIPQILKAFDPTDEQAK